MKTDKVIYIFTKDRPTTLQRIIYRLKSTHIPTVLIDDSVSSQTPNNRLCDENEVEYFGIKQQRDLLVSLGENANRFLKPLGTKDWNLGYARNYALCHAKKQSYEKVLFLDDDLIIDDENLIVELFNLITRNVMVGAKIVGMEDDSILGHIASDFQIRYDAMLSGGCLGFHADDINCHFLNVYNEDWIWQYLQKGTVKKMWYGSIEQEQYNPFSKFKKKILFQEIGEYYVDGIQEAIKGNDIRLLTNQSLWETASRDRRQHLNMLLAFCKKSRNNDFLSIINWLIENYRVPSASQMAQSWKHFFKDQDDFCQLLSSS